MFCSMNNIWMTKNNLWRRTKSIPRLCHRTLGTSTCAWHFRARWWMLQLPQTLAMTILERSCALDCDVPFWNPFENSTINFFAYNCVLPTTKALNVIFSRGNWTVHFIFSCKKRRTQSLVKLRIYKWDLQCLFHW